jgi:hypothetical protein
VERAGIWQNPQYRMQAFSSASSRTVPMQGFVSENDRTSQEHRTDQLIRDSQKQPDSPLPEIGPALKIPPIIFLSTFQRVLS